jgi:hypothetical protein
MPIESVGQAATHTPHCTHRSASMTGLLEVPEPDLPGGLVDVVHHLPDVEARH